MDLLTNIPGQWITQGGAVGILAAATVGILRGWLVPARTLDALLKIHADRLADEKARGDEWRAAAQAQQERNKELAAQMQLVIEIGRTTNAMVEAMQATTRKATTRGDRV